MTSSQHAPYVLGYTRNTMAVSSSPGPAEATAAESGAALRGAAWPTRCLFLLCERDNLTGGLLVPRQSSRAPNGWLNQLGSRAR